MERIIGHKILFRIVYDIAWLSYKNVQSTGNALNQLISSVSATIMPSHTTYDYTTSHVYLKGQMELSSHIKFKGFNGRF